jgi:hypothetical protein
VNRAVTKTRGNHVRSLANTTNICVDKRKYSGLFAVFFHLGFDAKGSDEYSDEYSDGYSAEKVESATQTGPKAATCGLLWAHLD